MIPRESCCDGSGWTWEDNVLNESGPLGAISGPVAARLEVQAIVHRERSDREVAHLAYYCLRYIEDAVTPARGL